MLRFPETLVAPEDTADAVATSVRRLFPHAAGPSPADGELEARVAALARAFVRSPRVSTDVGLESLIKNFLDSRIPSEPSDALQYVGYLAEHVVPHAVHTSSPRFIGHMTSALPSFVQPLGQLLTAMNQNVVKMETSKVLSFYERQTLGMMHRLVYDRPEEFYRRHIQQHTSTLGCVVSGGTLANITALWCARNTALGPREGFAGIDREGLPAALEHFGCREAVVVGSSLMHYSLGKAVDLLGLGARNLLRVAVDRRLRVDLKELRRVLDDCRARRRFVLAVVGVAGTTDSGAVDQLPELAGRAREHGAHFHVDAAWGGPLLFSERHAHKLGGIEQADSVTVDGHKQLYAPMGVGLVLFRDPQAARAIEKQARYIVRSTSLDLGKRSLEGSRPGMSLFLHAALNIFGRRGYAHLVDEGMRKTAYMAERLRARPEFELLAEPEINILVYRCLPPPLRARAAAGELSEGDELFVNRFNERLQKAQRRAGRSFVSRTSLELEGARGPQHVAALRAVIANPLTTETDIDAVLDEQAELAAELNQAAELADERP